MSNTPITPDTLAKVGKIVSNLYAPESDEHGRLMQAWATQTEAVGVGCLESFERMRQSSNDPAYQAVLGDLFNKAEPAPAGL